MRRLFVPVVLALTIILGASGVRAGNQEEANKIAQRLGEKYPQYNIEVAYQEGKVRLRGDIASEAEKAEITRFVQRIPKVRSVMGNFSVRPELTANPTATTTGYEASVSAKSTRSLPIPSIADQNVRAVAAEQPASPLYTEEVVYVDNQGIGAPIGAPVEAANTVTRAPSDYLAPQGVSVNAGNGQANLPNYAWPTYADYPNYSQVGYPKQYGAGTFPYIGPFYPYPQVPLGWRKVSMEWHDGYWWLDFNDNANSGPFSPLFRQPTTYR